MHMTKVVWFAFLAVCESFSYQNLFSYQKLAPIRAVFYLVQVSGASFLIACHSYKC